MIAGLSLGERRRGLLAGSFIGDALAMPVHWYYDQEALAREYGEVDDYLSPKHPHSGSILWRSHYEPLNAKGDILHEQAKYWGQRGVHYHQFLKAGENTLNLKLNRLLWASLEANGGWDRDDFVKRYIEFMLDPESHRDTYLEEYHRNFFHSYARGKDPVKCAKDEKHIGGLVFILPLLAWYGADLEKARPAIRERLALTHPGKKMAAASEVIIDLVAALYEGSDLRETLLERMRRQGSPFYQHSFERLLEKPTRAVLLRYFSTVCYVENSVPAVLYLLLKYADDPRQALIENTMSGGDNAYRGAVLGAILGAAHGEAGFPDAWVRGLVEGIPELDDAMRDRKVVR